MNMARQCWDETRHVQIYEKLIERAGGEVGEYPENTFLFEASCHDDPVLRVTGVNRCLEGLACDVFRSADRLRGRPTGDPVLAQAVDFVLADELTHVRFGSDWVREWTARRSRAREARARVPARDRPALHVRRRAHDRARRAARGRLLRGGARRAVEHEGRRAEPRDAGARRGDRARAAPRAARPSLNLRACAPSRRSRSCSWRVRLRRRASPRRSSAPFCSTRRPRTRSSAKSRTKTSPRRSASSRTRSSSATCRRWARSSCASPPSGPSRTASRSSTSGARTPSRSPAGTSTSRAGLLVLTNSEDELACVVGHEITHAAARHAAGRQAYMEQLSPFSLGLPRMANVAAYARDQERAADTGGQRICASGRLRPARDVHVPAVARRDRAPADGQLANPDVPRHAPRHRRADRLGGGLRVDPADAARARRRGRAREVPRPLREPDARRRPGRGRDPGQPLPAPRHGLRARLSGGLGDREHAGRGRRNSAEAQRALRARGRRDGRRSAGRRGAVPGQAARRGPGRDRVPGHAGDALLQDVRGARLGADTARCDRGPAHVDRARRARVPAVRGLRADRRRPVRRPRAPVRAQPAPAHAAEERDSVQVSRLELARAKAGETIPEFSARTGNVYDLHPTAIANGISVDARLEEGQLLKIGVRGPYRPAASEDALPVSRPGS